MRVLGQARLDETQAFTNMIEALKVASSSAKQLAYLREDQTWIIVQSNLEAMRERVTALAVQKLTHGAGVN